MHGEVYPIQDYVIKFVSDLRQVGFFFPGTLVSTTNKTDRHDVTEIFLKVALNIINQPANQPNVRRLQKALKKRKQVKNMSLQLRTC
jgi:hypothetical protein